MRIYILILCLFASITTQAQRFIPQGSPESTVRNYGKYQVDSLLRVLTLKNYNGDSYMLTADTNGKFILRPVPSSSTDSSLFLTVTDAAAAYTPLTRTLTINGTTYDLSANRSWTVAGGIDSTTAGYGLTETANSLKVDTSAIATQYDISGFLSSEVDGSTTNELQNLSRTGLAIGITSGTGITLPDSVSTTERSNWNAAYNDKINSLAFSGTGTKTLTLTQQDAGTVSNTFTDLGADTTIWATQSDIAGFITSNQTLTISSPLTGTSYNGSSPVSIGITNAAADGTTKGAAAFNASDFDATTGVVAIDYTNGQAASGSAKGFLTSANWITFNNSVDPGVITGSGLTMSTSRLLGRTTASTGAIEEITVASPLTFTGTTLDVTGISVADGGTGLSSTTANGVLLGGTTSTGAFQNAGTGTTAGHVLTSNGSGAAPTWQAVAASGSGSWVHMADMTATTTNGGTSMQQLVPGANKTIIIDCEHFGKRSTTQAFYGRSELVATTDGSGNVTISGQVMDFTMIDATGSNPTANWSVQGGNTLELAIATTGPATITWYTAVKYIAK